MAVAVEDVVSRERYEVSGRQDEMNALLHQLPHVEVVRIHERCRRDPEHVAGMQILVHCTSEKLNGIGRDFR